MSDGVKLIALKFRSQCKGCGAWLPVGTSAHWRKYVGVQCLGCGKPKIDTDGMVTHVLPDATRIAMLSRVHEKSSPR